MHCIVCKQKIEGLSEATTDGNVHSGQCMSHYLETKETLQESAGDVLAETELL